MLRGGGKAREGAVAGECKMNANGLVYWGVLADAH